MVGNSGAADERLTEVNASARSFPSRASGKTTTMGLNVIVTRPDRSFTVIQTATPATIHTPASTSRAAVEIHGHTAVIRAPTFGSTAVSIVTPT